MLFLLRDEQRATMPFDKVRIRFRKSGDLCMVSHLDLMRAFERMLRRANLPFRMTEGFHPTPRLIFAQSLSLGIIGLNEVVELELTEPTEPEDVLTRLQQQAPPGLHFLAAQRITIKTSARPRRAFYQLHGSTSQAHCDALLQETAIWVERERPRPRQVNIRPYLEVLRSTPDGVHAQCWLTQEGTVRADELCRILDLPPETTIERTYLEILDEVPADEAANTPTIEAQTRPWNSPQHTRPKTDTTPHEVWGATENGPIVE